MAHAATARIYGQIDDARWRLDFDAQSLPVVDQRPRNKQALVRGDFALIFASSDHALNARPIEQHCFFHGGGVLVGRHFVALVQTFQDFARPSAFFAYLCKIDCVEDASAGARILDAAKVRKVGVFGLRRSSGVERGFAFHQNRKQGAAQKVGIDKLNLVDLQYMRRLSANSLAILEKRNTTGAHVKFELSGAVYTNQSSVRRMAPVVVCSLESCAKQFPDLIKVFKEWQRKPGVALSADVSGQIEFTLECEKKDITKTYCPVMRPEDINSEFLNIDNPEDYDFTRLHVQTVIQSKLKKKSKHDIVILSNYSAYAIDAQAIYNGNADVEKAVLDRTLGPWIAIKAEPEELEYVPGTITDVLALQLGPRANTPTTRLVHNQQIFGIYGKDVLENHTFPLEYNGESYRALTRHHLLSEFIGIEETQHLNYVSLSNEPSAIADVFLLPAAVFSELCDMCYAHHMKTWFPLNIFDVALAMQADGPAHVELTLDWYFIVPRKQLPATMTAKDIVLITKGSSRRIEAILDSKKIFEFVKKSSYGIPQPQ
jgi:hypothetical protein